MKPSKAQKTKARKKERVKLLGSALLSAASDGDVQRIESLVGKTDPNVRDPLGKTPLMRAAHRGHLGAIVALLPYCDPLKLDRHGNSALMMSIVSGSAEIVQALLQASDPLQGNSKGETPLMKAVHSEDALIVRALLPFSDATAINGEGECALSIAIYRNDGLSEIIDLLIPATAHCPNCMIESMSSAVFYKDEQTGRKLLAYCGEAQSDEKGRTHLMCAAAHGDMTFVEMLLPVSDPLAAESEQGWSAADFAVYHGFPEVAERIKAHALSRVEKEQLGACLASPSLPGAAIKRRTL